MKVDSPLNFKKKQVLLFCLLSLFTFIRLNVWLTPSPLMPVLMEEMSISYAQSGTLVTMVSLFTGVFLLLGSIVLDKLGNMRAYILAIVFLALDGTIVFFTDSFSFMLAGRIMSGISGGLSSVASVSLIMQHFSPTQQGLINSINTAVVGIGTTAVYAITTPLYNTLGTWRGMMFSWSILSSGLFVLFLLYNKVYLHSEANSKTPPPKRAKLSIVEAVRLKELWFYSIAMIGAFFIYNALVAFLPTFLMEVRGFSGESAGGATGIMSIGGMIGGVTCGVLSVKVKNKNMMIMWIFAITALSHIGLCLFQNPILTSVCILVSGIGYSGWLPISLTAIMQIPGMNPKLIGGANAIYIGISNIIVFLVPSLFQAMETAWGMKISMLMFGISLIPSIASMLWLSIIRQKRISEEIAALKTV